MSIVIEVTRDGGDRDGGEISEPLLGDSLPAAIARGSAELDATATPFDRVTISLDATNDIRPGDLVAITEPTGATWRGLCIGIAHDWDGRTATTTIDIDRPRTT